MGFRLASVVLRVYQGFGDSQRLCSFSLTLNVPLPGGDFKGCVAVLPPGGSRTRKPQERRAVPSTRLKEA